MSLMTSAAHQADRHIATLTKRSDFLRANRGWRWVSPSFILLIHPRGDDSPASRAGYTVTKKTGNAVARNRIKRRFRALVREILPDQGIAGADHIFIGRDVATQYDWSVMNGDLVKALRHYHKNPDARPNRRGNNNNKRKQTGRNNTPKQRDNIPASLH